MKVQFVKESSGFGYSQKIASWLLQDPENAAAILDLSIGKAVELPESIAVNCYNLVNTATGKVISKNNGIYLTETQIKNKYVKAEEVKTKEIIDHFKAINTKKAKMAEVLIPEEKKISDSLETLSK
ncbi:MAG TPA: hypothetical protein VI815_02990 [Candidatus Nanoarchaeia archaeon]|nr:hypothetical protein [Candidatus Nanoarchaeia archaeon]